MTTILVKKNCKKQKVCLNNQPKLKHFDEKEINHSSEMIEFGIEEKGLLRYEWTPIIIYKTYKKSFSLAVRQILLYK